MNKPWLASYPEGVPEEIDPSVYPSVGDMFESSAAKFHESPAFANMGAGLSYAELNIESFNFGAYLQQALRMNKGDRVAIMLPNLLQYPVALFGILRAGMVVVNVNPQYTARELRHQLHDSGATVIVIIDIYAHVLEEVIADTDIKHVIVTGVGDMLPFPKSILVNFFLRYVKKKVPPYRLPGHERFKKVLSVGQTKQLIKPSLTHDDTAFLQYTGGTTGVAKGAVLTHGNMVANVLQATAWLRPVMKDREEIIITALPLYHIFSLTANCLTFMNLGALNYLITNPRDWNGFVKELSKVRFTTITGVNTLFNTLMETEGFSDLDFSSLKYALGGGMAVQPDVARRWQKITGCVLAEAYGLTETSPAACMNPVTLKEYNGTIGLPIPSTECCVRDEQGNELPPGEPGELLIRGPQVMKGYWNKPKETADTFTEDGWLKTGDMATIDESGYVRLVDRKKDIILVSGFNVYPNEIEAVMSAHAGVSEVAAIGVPDEESGEVVKLIVVKKDASLTADDLHQYARKELTGYKRPKYIEFTEELPKSNVGKILRRELREAEESQPA